jgi:murein DD-endopeptidase MepM/ murein hydrolase activator NlpD
MDIAAPNGTHFVAPADGVVTLAATDAFTLEGHLLMIDHGMGLNSAFLHCSELLVKEGDYVKQGQVIGRVGATGRASGPHLHWGMKWNSARIDPKLLLSSK